MDWFLHHWQSITAALIVAGTLGIFGLRLVRKPSRPGCGHNCGCGTKPGGPAKR